MLSSILAMMFLLAFLFNGSVAAEQKIKLHLEFFKVAKKLAESGHGEDALAFFVTAAQLVESSLGEHADVAYIYQEMGNTLRMAHRYGAAEELIRRALNILSSELPAGDINTLRCLNDIGYQATGRLQEAREAFDKVIASIGNAQNIDLLTITADAYANRGGVSIYEDKLNSARRDLTAALVAAQKAKAGDSDTFELEKDAELNLAYVALDQDKMAEAVQAVAQARRLIENSGKNQR